MNAKGFSLNVKDRNVVDQLERAAEVFAKGSWEDVYKAFPDWEPAIRATRLWHSNARKAGKQLATPSNYPTSDLEAMGHSLILSIGHRALKYRKAQPKLQPAVAAVAETETSRAIAALMDRCAREKGILPDTGTIAILTDKTPEAVVRAFGKLSDRWSFDAIAVQFPDDTRMYWKAIAKPQKTQEEIEIEKLKEMIAALEERVAAKKNGKSHPSEKP